MFFAWFLRKIGYTFAYWNATVIQIEKVLDSYSMNLEYFWQEKCKGVRQQMKCPLSVPIEPCVFRINLQKNFSCLVVFACMSLYFCVCSLDETNNFFIEPIVEIFTSFKSFSCLYIEIFPHTSVSRFNE